MPNQDESLLLYLNEAIATTRSKEKLFQIVTEKLRLIFPFDMIAVVTFDAAHQFKRLFMRNYLGDAPYAKQMEQESPVAGSPAELFIRDARVQVIDIRALTPDYPGFMIFLLMQ